MNVSRGNIQRFRREILSYFRVHKRNLPWRKTENPYCILISEVMLQQTQVERVIPKYHAFLKQFPDFQSLAAASQKSVLRSWLGLGYNRRALSLKKLSGIVMARYGGKLPDDPKLLEELPGIGRASAGAISVFAFSRPTPFIETNIRRVFIHFFFPKKKRVRDEDILKLVKATAPKGNTREWFWALMDYGAMLGRCLPKAANPNRRNSRYRRQAPFRGSARELRGKILKLLASQGPVAAGRIAQTLRVRRHNLDTLFGALEDEGFIRRAGGRTMLR